MGPSDKSLLARVRDGSEDAATALYAKYAQRLLRLARAKCADDLTGTLTVDPFLWVLASPL